MKRMTPDTRAGLSVTGILLLILGVALGVISLKTNGMPNLPMPNQEVTMLGIAGAACLLGLGCLLKGTEPQNIRK